MRALILSIFCLPLLSWAQTDTLLRYDVKAGVLHRLETLAPDTSIQFDSTASFAGILQNIIDLPPDPPVANLFPGSQFSDLARAAAFFPVTAYPVRTALKLIGFRGDTLVNNCSAVLIGNRFALTAAHCIINFKHWNNDSLLAAPAYDEGNFQPALPYSMVDHYYFFSSWYHSFRTDIALLQLREPIGAQTGWVGMTFAADTAFFSSRVFHKFSYPSVPNPFDTTKVYNGDTLYYNYGMIRAQLPDYMYIPGLSVQGIPGQSGSPLLYAGDDSFQTTGVMNFSNGYRHYRIDNKVFTNFRHIISSAAGFDQPRAPDDLPLLSVSPNPFSLYTTVTLKNPELPGGALQLYDVNGKLVREQKLGNEGNTVLLRLDLPSGLYYLYLFFSGRIFTGTKVIVL